jgi:hypothetical protein
MKTPEQATMEFITNHLAKEKDKWEDGREEKNGPNN